MGIPRYNKCTIWTKGAVDPLTGIAALGDARVYKCEVKRGGSSKLSDKKGAEFYPASTFWVRLSDLVTGAHVEPKEGDMIAKGSHYDVAVPSDVNAEVVRAVLVHNHVKFGESESYTIGTDA